MLSSSSPSGNSKIVFICQRCRNRLASPSRPISRQQRWITQNHIRNIRAAEEDWAKRAADTRAGRKRSMLSILEERGFINQIIGNREALDLALTERRNGAYVGVDPTAPSLHIGHMIPFMALAWLYIHGYAAYFVLGGTTAAIGDPTDRLVEREMTQSATRKANMANMHMQLKKLGVRIEKTAKRHGYHAEWAWSRALENNSKWWGKVSFSEVIKTMGSEVRLGPLLGRDTVKKRMETKDGMSLAEFIYPMMQAWDWWYLYQRGVQIQIGGADQFGNILAGADAVTRVAKKRGLDCLPALEKHNNYDTTDRIGRSLKEIGKIDPKGVPIEPIGLTVPLLTNSANEKLGKSAGNAIWMDPEMTSSFDLYQFFLRSADADVERYLKLLTFFSVPKIHEILAEHERDPSKRIAQRRLAFEFVHLAHGEEAAETAKSQHLKLFSSNVISVQSLLEQTGQPQEKGDEPAQQAQTSNNRQAWNPSINKYAQPTRMDSNQPMRIKLPRSLVENQPIHRVLWSARLASSKQEGHKLVANKGCHVGAQSQTLRKLSMGDDLTFHPLKNFAAAETDKYIIDNSLLVLRIGKWKIRLITIVSDEEFEKLGLSCPGWKDEEETKGDSHASVVKDRRKNTAERKTNWGIEKIEERTPRKIKPLMAKKSGLTALSPAKEIQRGVEAL